jgi:hypothetical protein
LPKRFRPFNTLTTFPDERPFLFCRAIAIS